MTSLNKWIGAMLLLGVGGCQSSESEIPLIRTGSEFNQVRDEAQKLAEPIFLKYREPGEYTAKEKSDLKRALNLFEGLIGFQSNAYPLFMGSGRAAYLLGKNDLAIDRLRRCIQLSAPTDAASRVTAAEAYYLGSRIYESEPDFPSARQAALQAVKLMPRSPDYLSQLASCQIQMNEVAEASKNLRSALAVDPGHPRAKALQKLLQVSDKP